MTGSEKSPMAEVVPSPTTGPWALVRRLTRFREFLLIAIILVAGVAMSFASDVFLTSANLQALLLSMFTDAIIAIGMTILLVSGGFDLSVGSVAALSGAVAAQAMAAGMPVPLAILCGLALGAGIGAVNGSVIAKIGINPFITTLAMMSIARGALQVMMQGRNISDLPEAFKVIGQGNILDVQAPIWIAVILVVVGDWLMRKTRFFRQNYYLGGNEKAAVLSGIRVDRLKIFNYALTGFLAALAGVVYTARMGSATVTAGVGWELRVISAVVIGGASLQGGEGTVLGAFLGCVLMAMIMNSLTLLNVNQYWTTLVIGATLLLAVLADTFGRRRK